MRNATFLLVFLTVSVQVAASQVPALETEPLAGTWDADLSTSTFQSGVEFQRLTLRIAVARDTVTMTSDIVTTDGQDQHATETLRTGGTENEGTLTQGVTHVTRWFDPHVLVTVAKKDGQVIAIQTFEVSADGDTLTTRSTGVVEQVIIYRRR